LYFIFYYFGIWKKLRLFSNYLHSFDNIDLDEVKNTLRKLKYRLEKQPLLKILIFHMILNETEIFEGLNKKVLTKLTKTGEDDVNKQNEKKDLRRKFFSKINTILTTTDLIYDGIYELVKNIITHAGGKYGFVTFRMFKREVLEGMYNNNPENFKRSFNKYINSLKQDKDEKHEFIEVSVVDNGSDGIIKKGLQNLTAIKKKFESYELNDEKNKIKQQINEIKEKLNDEKQKVGELIFNSFYSEKSLKHGRQSIKSAAGFGLIIFMNGIKRLSGSFTLSTIYNAHTYGFINYFKKGEHSSEESDFFENAFAPGTTYNIVIPLFPVKEENSDEGKDIISNRFSFENIFSGSNIVYEHLLKIKKSIKKEFSSDIIKKDIKSADVLLLDYLLKGQELSNHSNFDGNNKKIIAFDLSQYKGDSSDIIRFLATLQFNLQGINAIVLYNENMERAKKLLQILTIYDELGLDFWSDQNAVLFYYQNNDHNAKYMKMIFSFLLLGKSHKDFLSYNNTLSGPHFIRIPGIEDLKKESNNEYKPLIESIPLFIGEDEPTQMLYMHLILEKETNKTIFENNVAVLLNKLINKGK